jgi:hypothetical protein
VVAVNNPTIVTPPVVQNEEVSLSQQEEEVRFGFDFNMLVETPSSDEESGLDDPVTTGGDSSSYSSEGGTPTNPGGPSQ